MTKVNIYMYHSKIIPLLTAQHTLFTSRGMRRVKSKWASYILHTIAFFKTKDLKHLKHHVKHVVYLQIYYISYQTANTPGIVQAGKFSGVIHASIELPLVSQIMSRLLVFFNWWAFPRQSTGHSPGTHCIHDAEWNHVHRRGFPFLSGFFLPIWAHAVPVW